MASDKKLERKTILISIILGILLNPFLYIWGGLGIPPTGWLTFLREDAVIEGLIFLGAIGGFIGFLIGLGIADSLLKRRKMRRKRRRK